MKFHTLEDSRLFLLEIGRADLIDKINDNYIPPDELVELFLKKRKKLFAPLKDFRRKQNTKASWKRNRKQYMRGIKRFHKSTAGKKFHRALGRFLATREDYKELSDVVEVLTALSSLNTHVLIELDYFHPLTESIEYHEFIEDLIPVTSEIKIRFIKGDISISEDEESFLLSIIESAALIKSLASKSGKSEKEVEKVWDKIKAQALEKGKKEDDPDFWKYITGTTKKIIGL